MEPIGWHDDSRVFKDVDVALHWAAQYSVGASDVGSRIFYRGQSNADWDFLPSLLRLDRREQPKGEKETHQFIEALKRRFPQYRSHSKLQLLAIAQHYGFPTKLLDYTLDAKVAAFFAAPGGSPKEQSGLIHFIPEREFNEFQNPFGGIGLPDSEGRQLMKQHQLFVGKSAAIEVPDVPRIARQKAVFVWGSSPGVLRREFRDRYCFPQHAQEAFIDPAGVITFDHLFPEKDPIYEFVVEYDRSKAVTRLHQYASSRQVSASRRRPAGRKPVRSTPASRRAVKSAGSAGGANGEVEKWKAFAMKARTELERFLVSPAAIDASDFKDQIVKLVEVLSRELRSLQESTRVRPVNRALARIVELRAHEFGDERKARIICEDVRETLSPMVRGRDHDVASVDPLRGALGEIAAFVVALADVQYINAHAGAWAARQTAQRSAGDRLRGAVIYFGWLEQ